MERGWTPLPFQCFAPADSTREISTVPLYPSHPRQKFDFACPREAGRLRRLRGPAKNARGQQKTKVSVEHGQACTCSNGMQGRAHLFRCLLMPAAFGVSMGGSTAGHGAPVGTRLGIEARRSSWRVLLGTVSKNAGKLLIRLEKRLRGEGLFWKVFALFKTQILTKNAGYGDWLSSWAHTYAYMLCAPRAQHRG